MIALADFADPVDIHPRQALDVVIGPSERNTHPQPDEDTEQLYDVGVRHRVQPSEQGVEYRDTRGQDNRGLLFHVDDDRQGSAEGGQDTGSPEHLSAQSRQKQQSSHALSKAVLQRIQHGDVTLLSHRIGEEDSTWGRKKIELNFKD